MEKARTDENRITRRRMARILVTALVAVGLVVSVSACGKKGPPEPPLVKTDKTGKTGKKSDFPRAYPDPKSY